MGLLVLALMALAICNTAPVPGLAQPVSTQEQQEYLTEHNQARAAVRVGPLKWNNSLANAATRLIQSNIKNCTYTNDAATNYGMNQYKLFAKFYNRLPGAVVRGWVETKKYYNYAKNKCVPRGKPCSTYTQVVSRKSRELGCAQAKCAQNAGFLTICLYNPPGNIVGQRPY